MDVDVALGQKLRVDAELLGARAHQAERGGRGFLHHVADLAGERDVALAGHARGLDEEDLAADRRVGQPGRDAGHAGALRQLRLEPRRAERLADAVACRR